MSEPVVPYGRGNGVKLYGKKKPSFWQRVVRNTQITGIGLKGGTRKSWYDFVGTMTAYGFAAVSTYVIGSTQLPAAVKAVITTALAGPVAIKVGASFWSETMKVVGDERTKDKEARAAAEAEPVVDPEIAGLKERLARLEMADMEMRQNNAAALADMAQLREQNTALQQSNHAVRTQNVELHNENAQLKSTVESLWNVVQAHSVLFKGQEKQLADHEQTLGRQGQSIARHDSALAGHGETLLGHENRLQQHDSTLKSHDEQLRKPPPQAAVPTPPLPFPDTFVDAKQGPSK